MAIGGAVAVAIPPTVAVAIPPAVAVAAPITIAVAAPVAVTAASTATVSAAASTVAATVSAAVALSSGFLRREMEFPGGNANFKRRRDYGRRQEDLAESTQELAPRKHGKTLIIIGAGDTRGELAKNAHRAQSPGGNRHWKGLITMPVFRNLSGLRQERTLPTTKNPRARLKTGHISQRAS